MCVKSGAEPRGIGVWILGGHGPHLFCLVAAAACLHGALWWPYHALYMSPSLVLQVLDTKISTEPQLGLETVGGWNIRR